MILHSVTDLSLITPFTPEKPLYMNVDGCICECVKNENEYVIKRLISTNLEDYLKLSPYDTVKGV